MRRLTKILSTLALSVIGCWSAQCESTNDSLTFFIVREQEIEGGRFIDSTNFPKLGYVAAKPDLTVTNIADVFPAKVAKFDIEGDGKGMPPLWLTIELKPEDAKRFTTLTKKAVSKRLLIMLGNKPLTAPKVVIPIESPGFVVDVANQEELEQLEKTLKKLVR